MSQGVFDNGQLKTHFVNRMFGRGVMEEEENVVDVSLSSEDLIRLASPFAQLMNDLQRESGERVHEVVSAGLYAMGCALAQIGVHIDIEASVKESIGPLAIGYAESMEKVKRRMI